ncbi:MAG: hypothetical protein IJL74_03100 [Bacilli bacterium]|nr:hypothetical protein [Bacilli bacterium]
MEEKVKKVIAKPLEKLNMVVDSISFEKGNLNIVLDSDEVIDLNRIVEASHLINDILDKEDFIKNEYMLDISSKEKGGN